MALSFKKILFFFPSELAFVWLLIAGHVIQIFFWGDALVACVHVALCAHLEG
jgi:hypothetical protein